MVSFGSLHPYIWPIVMKGDRHCYPQRSYLAQIAKPEACFLYKPLTESQDLDPSEGSVYYAVIITIENLLHSKI